MSNKGIRRVGKAEREKFPMYVGCKGKKKGLGRKTLEPKRKWVCHDTSSIDVTLTVGGIDSNNRHEQASQKQ